VGPTLENEDERTVFLDAIEESLRPLMRVVFEYGVSYQDLVEVVRALYVYGLRDKLEAQGKPPTAARLGLMAGITKAEIRDLFTRREIKAQLRALATQRLDQLSLLLGKWHDDPQFSTPYGAPLDLSLVPDNTFRTFDELIEASETTLDRKSAIEALLENRCAEIQSGQFIRCTTRSFFPIGKDMSRVARLARLGSAMHSTYVHNLFRGTDEPSFFERTMVTDFPLSKSARNSVLGQVRQDGEDFIDGFDRWIASKEADYRDDAGERFGVTTFFFKEVKESDDIAYIHRLVSGGISNE
jgi:hypothetical protein